jgi:hypothetical protein
VDIRAWAEQRVCYSRARRGRFERGAQIGECGLVEAMAFAIARRQAWGSAPVGLPAPAPARARRALVAPPPAA